MKSIMVVKCLIVTFGLSAMAQTPIDYDAKFEKQMHAYAKVEEAKMSLVEAYASTLLDKDLQCTEQFAMARIETIMGSSLLANLKMHQMRTGKIPKTATVEDILKNYPSLNQFMDKSLSLKAGKVMLFSRMSQDIRAMIPAFLVGIKVYLQKSPGRGLKQPSLEFLENGVVKASDKDGVETTGTWTVDENAPLKIYGVVNVTFGEETKSMNLVRDFKMSTVLPSIDSYQPALIVPGADGQKDEVYTSVTWACMAYAG